MADEETKISLQGTKAELMQLVPQLSVLYQLFEKHFDRGLYTIPVTTFQDHYTFAPQVKLVFYQLRNEVNNNRPRVHGEIAYRIMGETAQTLSRANAELRAARIKDLFTEPDLFVWQKGKESASYLDRLNGYDFRLLVRNETEARRIITQVMAIEGQTPDFNLLRMSISSASYPEDPGTTLIFGKERRKPRRRPREDIKFRYAELHLWGMSKPVTLVDTIGTREQPLVTVL